MTDPAETSFEPALTVLVADDIPSSREELAATVRAFGHRVIEADSGARALALARQEEPDILLLDLLMPDVDGFEVTRRLRDQVRGRWLPVIVTSSLQGEEHFIHALSSGADDYLGRPVSPPLLEAKLRHYRRVLGLQARLVALAQRQQSIHDAIADAVITVDESETVREVNRAARAFLPDDQPVGRPLREALGRDLAALLARPEQDLAGRDGRHVPVAVSAGRWALGPHRFTTVALHDLTEQRRVERMKDEFLATVSHELRTPLTSVLGALALLASGVAGDLPAPARELTAVARRNGERLGRLIDDVLDLTKLEGNRMPLHPRNCDLHALVTEAVSANTAYAQRSRVAIDWQPRAKNPRGLVDPDRFLQIMANLLSNAVKHSPADQTVRVSLDGAPQGWRIAVSDQGPGIDPAFRSRLFEKFEQADSSDRRSLGGTGLGLYISRLLVERMGGQIGVESEPGRGATFHVTLPACRLEGGWILCLGRDHERLERLALWLSPLAPVETAFDVPGAADLVSREGPPDVLVADPQGHEPLGGFCEALRRLAPADRIILTGDSIDPAFAAKLGVPWAALHGGSAEPLMAFVRHHLQTPPTRQEPT